MRLLSILGLVLLLAGVFVVSGCSSHSSTPAADQMVEAKKLFDQITRDYHLPSADAQGAEKAKLLQQAAAGYETLLKKFPNSVPWAPQSLRSLGNISAEQGKLDEAVQIYSSVATRYPASDWEILQSWKSAADLLWEANRHGEAKAFYQRIVTRFDNPSASAVIRTIVRASQNRLSRG